LIRDRLTLEERTEALFTMVRRWKPYQVRYEEYSMQCDIPHIRGEQERLKFRFAILPVGGSTAKKDRIKRLIPLFSAKRIFFPEHVWYTTHDGKSVDLVNVFLQEEYQWFPALPDYDMLDALSRLCEDQSKFPLHWPQTSAFFQRPVKDPYDDDEAQDNESWMAV
jgi:hypothetical protein